MRKFTDIHIIGFGSIGNMEFDFDQQGLNIFQGDNGLGKTTLLSALSWVWYKKPLKDVENIATWEHLRDENWEGTMVSSVCYIEGVEHKVVRCINYKGLVGDVKGGNGLFYYIGGIPFLEYQNKIDLNKIIIDNLGFSFELFKNTIVFGQKMKRLIEETGSKQKSVFDEIFESNYINKAKETCKTNLVELNQSTSQLQGLIEIGLENIQEKKAIIKQVSETDKKQKALLKERKNHLKTRIKEWRVKILSYDEVKGTLSKILKNTLKEPIPPLKQDGAIINMGELQGKLYTYLHDIEILTDNIEVLGDELKQEVKVCGKCEQTINKKQFLKQREDIKLLKQKKEKTLTITRKLYGKCLKKVDELNAKTKTTKLALEKYQTLKQSYTEQQTTINNLNNTKENQTLYQQLIDKALLDIKDLKFVNNKDLIQKHKKEIKTKKAWINKNQKIIELAMGQIQDLEWLIKDALSNKGIKAFLFQHLIEELNEALLEYCPIIEGIIEFRIDTAKAAQDFKIVVIKDGNEIPYADLSGGQSQLVNVVIAFGMHSITMSNKPVNILLMDEVFESLSNSNIEKVALLIEMKSTSSSVFLVTHSDSFISTNSRVYNFSLDNGYTSIV